MITVKYTNHSDSSGWQIHPGFQLGIHWYYTFEILYWNPFAKKMVRPEDLTTEELETEEQIDILVFPCVVLGLL